jgi:hypothetical protein
MQMAPQAIVIFLVRKNLISREKIMDEHRPLIHLVALIITFGQRIGQCEM